jgi:hypothetical protein
MVGIAETGPFGPTRQNPPLGVEPDIEHASALAVTGSDSVTKTFAPVGTSTWPSAGYANTTPGGAAGGVVELLHAASVQASAILHRIGLTLR